MTNEVIEQILAKRVAAKVAKSNDLGTKASWTQEDQTAFAVEVIMQLTGAPESMRGELASVFTKVYNQSATAQKLAKVFEKSGHFQRESREKKAMSGFEEMLKNLGAV